MGTRRYRQHSAADKVAILRRVLLEGQAVSTVCEKHDVSPTLFYTWPKQFFEHGAAAFAKEASAERRDLERQIDALQQRLGQKDRVIAKVTEEFVKLKKELGNPERRVGSPRHAGRRDRLRGPLECRDRPGGLVAGRLARPRREQVFRLEAARREGERAQWDGAPRPLA